MYICLKKKKDASGKARQNELVHNSFQWSHLISQKTAHYRLEETTQINMELKLPAPECGPIIALLSMSFTPDVSHRTKPNEFFIELNRTNSEDIERLNSMLFDHRTKSDNYFFMSSISEPNRTKSKLSVRFSSIKFGNRTCSLNATIQECN